jgi:CHAT domain-containing protein
LEESFRGQGLALEGRCPEAIPILNQSITLYKIENVNADTSDSIRDASLIREISILQSLISCYFSLNDEDALIAALTEILEIRQVLTTRSYLSASAQEGLRELSDSLDIWRVRLVSDEERIAVLDKSQVFFAKLTKILAELNDAEGALVAAEKGRARAIADLISNGLSEAPDDRTRIAEALSIEEIRLTAQEQEAIFVEYAVIPSESDQADALYIWVVEPSGEVHLKSKLLEDISLTEIISASRQALGARSRGAFEPVDAEPQPDIQKVKLRKLYQLLIEPIQDWLPRNETDRVVFIPQDELFLVPFAALLDNNEQPVITKHTVSTAPSIQVLNLTHQRRMQIGDHGAISGAEVLLVGNPDISNTVGSKGLNLSDLPNAEVEVRAIASLYDAQPLIRMAASETAIKQRMPAAKIIHLATHGLLESLDDEPELAIPGSVVLAADRENDGLLTSSEILQMHLNAELVVLSACDTGLGDIKGDGVIGLSRSLLQAGAPSVLVSLWAVPDESTAELMTEFYQHLQPGLDKAQALRKAMLKTMTVHSDPAQWAAFVLVGEAT